MDPGLQFVGPVPDLGGIPGHAPRDPNMPSKAEQFRMIAVETVVRCVQSGHVTLAAGTEAKQIVDHAKLIMAFFDKG